MPWKSVHAFWQSARAPRLGEAVRWRAQESRTASLQTCPTLTRAEYQTPIPVRKNKQTKLTPILVLGQFNDRPVMDICVATLVKVKRIRTYRQEIQQNRATELQSPVNLYKWNRLQLYASILHHNLYKYKCLKMYITTYTTIYKLKHVSTPRCIMPVTKVGFGNIHECCSFYGFLKKISLAVWHLPFLKRSLISKTNTFF